jgi:hypothetical protein
MPPVYALLVLAVGLVEVFAIYRALKNRKRARLLADTATLPVSALGPGPAKLRGKVVALCGAMRAPLSGAPCVYYHFRAEEQKRHAGPHGGGAHWKTVVDDALSVPFAVDDGTGLAAVSLDRAELVLDRAESRRSGFLNSAPPELEETLRRRYGRSSAGLVFNKAMRYSETRIEEGEDLIVLGTVRPTPGGNWEVVRGAAPLVVSDKGEAALVSSYRWAAAGWGAVAALVLAGAGLAALA